MSGVAVQTSIALTELNVTRERMRSNSKAWVSSGDRSFTDSEPIASGMRDIGDPRPTASKTAARTVIGAEKTREIDGRHTGTGGRLTAIRVIERRQSASLKQRFACMRAQLSDGGGGSPTVIKDGLAVNNLPAVRKQFQDALDDGLVQRGSMGDGLELLTIQQDKMRSRFGHKDTG